MHAQDHRDFAAVVQIMFEHVINDPTARHLVGLCLPIHRGRFGAQSAGVQRSRQPSIKANVSSRATTISAALRAGDSRWPHPMYSFIRGVVFLQDAA
jgi:hypothetical protein